jgi:hypothetical protein
LGGAYCRRRNAKVNAPNSPDAEPNGEATGLVDRA